MMTVWFGPLGGTPTGTTVGVPFTVRVAEPLMTVPADPEVTTKATPWPLEHAPGATVGRVMASGLTVAETVSATVVVAGVGVHVVVVPSLTQKFTGTPGMPTGPTVADTVTGAAVAGLAKANAPVTATTASEKRVRPALNALFIDALSFWWHRRERDDIVNEGESTRVERSLW